MWILRIQAFHSAREVQDIPPSATAEAFPDAAIEIGRIHSFALLSGFVQKRPGFVQAFPPFLH